MMADPDLLADVLERPDGERESFLAANCSDAEQRTRIVALLRAHARASTILQPLTVARPFAAGDPAGATIGRYQLLEKIGEGGCAVVWMAQQEQPVRRRVALKILKLGMDTNAVVARFEAERQALAMMDHPNIAHVFDGGATEIGRPYFVMELVRGVPITQYCDEHRLTPTARLELFVKVCQAVQHAHQKGVIHRDLKPSNILVTLEDGRPVPKVIDFGIAKAIAGRLTDTTLATAIGQFMGTPAYMSPEQAGLGGLDIDTRSDIYSLGVVLYQLLTGRRPFDNEELRNAGLDTWCRHIREIDAPRPSTLLRTLRAAELAEIAQRRQSTGLKLIGSVRGDLDWIVMKAMEKERTRRYETANGLAADIQRHLSHEPVLAGAPGAAYRLGKLIRRNRLAFAAGLAIAATLVVGLGVSTWMFLQAERARAEEARQRGLADAGRTREASLRAKAEAQELAARRRAYASDIVGVQHALENDNLNRARELLYRQRPAPGHADLRGWEWRYLWQFCQSDATGSLPGPGPGAINSLSASPDGKWVAIGALREVVLHHLQSGEQIRIPAGQAGTLAAFSPREPLLAIACHRQPNDLARRGTPRAASPAAVVLLWDLRTRAVVRELPVNDQFGGLQFSADGATLAVLEAGIRNAVTVWSVAAGRKLAHWPAGGPRDYWFGDFAATRDLSLAARVEINQITVLDLKTGRQRWRAAASDQPVIALAFSPEGTVLATGGGSAEPVIRLWDIASGREIGQLEGHHAMVSRLVFLRDGALLASAASDQTIRVWDIASRTLLRTFRGHLDEIRQFVVLPDERTAISADKNGVVLRWDLAADRAASALSRIPNARSGWAFGDSGQEIFTASPEGTIARFDGPMFQRQTVLLEVGPIGAARFAPKQKLVALGQNQSSRVWNWEKRALVWEGGGTDGPALMPLRITDEGRTLWAWTITILHRVDLLTGRQTGQWNIPPELARVTRPPLIIPEEKKALFMPSGGEINGISLDLTTGETKSFPAYASGIALPAISSDGRLLALPNRFSYVRILARDPYREMATYRGFMHGVHSAAFSPAGDRLVTGGTALEALTLWDLHSHERLMALSVKEDLLAPVAFSPDGAVIAGQGDFGADAGTLHLWRAPTWAEIEAAEKKIATAVRH